MGLDVQVDAVEALLRSGGGVVVEDVLHHGAGRLVALGQHVLPGLHGVRAQQCLDPEARRVEAGEEATVGRPLVQDGIAAPVVIGIQEQRVEAVLPQQAHDPGLVGPVI